MAFGEVIQLIASGVSIVDCSYRLAKFIKELSDDVRDIHDWLTEMKASIDTLQRVLGRVKTIAKDPHIKDVDDDLVELICTIVQGSKSQAAKILEKLPPEPANGILPKVEAVLRKLMKDRAIKEHEFAILKWTVLLQTTVGERTSQLGQIHEDEVSAPPYGSHDKLESIKLEVDTMLHDGSHEIPNIQTGVNPPMSIIDKANGQKLQSYESRVAALESESRFLDAATEQGILINLRRGLKEHIQFTAQDEALLVERQADYLLRCVTVGRHLEAAKLLEDLIDKKALMLADTKVIGRIWLKIGELYMEGGKLGRVKDAKRLDRARHFLERAATLLGDLSPFPHVLYLRSMNCLVRTLETLEETDTAQHLKEYLEKQLSNDPDARLDCPINWGYAEEPAREALAWCRTQTNPAFDVESPHFKFDRTDQGTSAIHSAVRDGKLEVVREMLVEVEEIDAHDSDGSTPLMIAAEQRYADISDIFELLLDHKASLDEVDNYQQTVLHRCQTSARDGHDITMATLSLHRKPNLINSREASGKTALWMACEKSNEKMVKFLLDNKADPNISSTKNQTPLQVAVEMRSSEGSRKRQVNRLRIIEMLLEGGADSNQGDNLGNTPLHTAAAHEDLDVVKLLLQPDYKTRVDLPGRHGQTPVAAAAERRHISVVKELVSHGASITSKGAREDGKSAEDWAKGDHNKALRDAFHAADSRRLSEGSAGTIWHANRLSTSSGSVQTHTSSSSTGLRRIYTGRRSNAS
ncbi:ankyrin repeat-containing domain protein [Nemania serpens]|nr:ankyrin repeat-containing domain protein [Nemania serpens]